MRRDKNVKIDSLVYIQNHRSCSISDIVKPQSQNNAYTSEVLESGPQNTPADLI